MSHEVESMFSVRETPWHKLGQVLPAAPESPEQACKAAGADWSVSLATLACGAHDVPANMARAVKRDDTGAVLGVVGPRFRPIQNADLFAWCDPVLQQGARFETGGVLRGGSIVWALLALPQCERDIVPGDAVKAYLLASNRHDGSQPAELSFVATRVVCANTLGAAERERGRQRIQVRHSGDVAAQLEAAANAVQATTRTFAESCDAYSTLARRQCDQKSLRRYVKDVFKGATPEATVDVESIMVQTERLAAVVQARADRAILTIGDILAETEARTSGVVEEALQETESRLYETIATRFESAPGANFARGSWWAAYNAVTHYVTHDRGHQDERRLASAIGGENARITQRALTSALDLSA